MPADGVFGSDSFLDPILYGKNTQSLQKLFESETQLVARVTSNWVSNGLSEKKYQLHIYYVLLVFLGEPRT